MNSATLHFTFQGIIVRMHYLGIKSRKEKDSAYDHIKKLQRAFGLLFF